MRKFDNQYGNILAFDGVREQMLEVAKNRQQLQHYLDYCKQPSWLGRDDLSTPEALRQAVHQPWPHGIQVIQRMLKALEQIELPVPTRVSRSKVWREDEGETIDLDRFQEGRPYWRGTRRRPVTGPTIRTIAVQVDGFASTKADDIFWCGAAATAITSVLEDAGYSVELLAFSYGTRVYPGNPQRSCLQTWMIKEAHDYLNLNDLVNATSSWYMRTITFATLHIPEQPNPHLGAPTPATPEILSAVIEPNELILIQNLGNEKATVEFLITTLEKMSCVSPNW